MRAKLVIFVVAVCAGVLLGACEQRPSATLSPSPVTVSAPTGTLSVTPNSGVVGTQPIVTWDTTATNAVIQVCQIQGADCVGYREIVRGGSTGQTKDSTPLPLGNWRYRLLGYNSESFVFTLTTQDVVIN